MPAVHVAIRQIGVRYQCDHCGRGEMTYVHEEVGVATATLGWPLPGPRKYKHICNQCFQTAELLRMYPCTDLVMAPLPQSLSEITPA